MPKRYWIYNLLTLGWYGWYVRKKAQQKALTVNTQLTVSDKVPFALEAFWTAIGGIDNYVSNQATINSISITVVDLNKVDRHQLIKLGAKGTILSSDKITCLFGDYSQKLASLLDSYTDEHGQEK